MLEYPLWKKILVLIVCLWGLLEAIPNFLPKDTIPSDLPSWLPGKTVNLGLDLQGGIHLLLELQADDIYKARMESVEKNLRQDLRKEKIRAHSIRLHEGELAFTLADPLQSEFVQDLLIKTDSNLEIEADAAEGRFKLSFKDDAKTNLLESALNQSIEVVRRRIDEFGTTEPLIQRQGLDRILVQVPGMSDSAGLKALLNTTAKLSIHLVERTVSKSAFDNLVLQADQLAFPSEERPEEILIMTKSAVVGGEDLENAQSTFQNGTAVVNFTFNSEGARKFGAATAANVGKQLAIVLDDMVISAPVVNEPILGGSGIISGNFNVQSAEKLAVLLRAGALPAPLIYVEERTVGAGLGQDSVKAGELSGLIALVAVSIFMVLVYGRFGVYSVVALVLNLFLILAVMTALRITLTLPGIAGFVLTIGMAVDANVLIFERIREEIRLGRNPANAIDAGYKRAFATIIDSNLTTLIAAILLFTFGSGTIKGFALTLSIGIISSMFTAIMVTRYFVVAWLKRTRPKQLTIQKS